MVQKREGVRFKGGEKERKGDYFQKDLKVAYKSGVDYFQKIFLSEYTGCRYLSQKSESIGEI